jgi:hypothetical protein
MLSVLLLTLIVLVWQVSLRALRVAPQGAAPDVAAFRPHWGAPVSRVDLDLGYAQVHIERPNAPVSIILSPLHSIDGDATAAVGGVIRSFAAQPGAVTVVLDPPDGAPPVTLVAAAVRYSG